MKNPKLHFLIVIIAALCLVAATLQADAKPVKDEQSARASKERLVLMPLRIPEEEKDLAGAMETALVKGLQQKYDVYSGEVVSKKAHEVFLKESRNTAHTECDEIKCMQNIAMAFQAELIATANVTKKEGSYFLALSIQNIFDNKVVYSESLPCERCNAVQVVEKLKELSGTQNRVAPQEALSQNKIAITTKEEIIRDPIMVPIPGKNYEIGKYDVTQAEWRAVMGGNPSKFTSCGDTCPVEQVSWYRIQEFLKKLNTKTGRLYRLPTEEEWEYACYAGTKTEYCGGNDLDSVAWFSSNSSGATHPTGRKQANGYGLYDMSGNVWQWMENESRRGGSWNYGPIVLHATWRDGGDVKQGFNEDIGFRLARTIQ